MAVLSNVEAVAIDIICNNSFLTMINALSKNDLDSLLIKNNANAEIFKKLNDEERAQLSSILNGMCEKKAHL